MKKNKKHIKLKSLKQRPTPHAKYIKLCIDSK